MNSMQPNSCKDCIALKTSLDIFRSVLSKLEKSMSIIENDNEYFIDILNKEIKENIKSDIDIRRDLNGSIVQLFTFMNNLSLRVSLLEKEIYNNGITIKGEDVGH